MDLGFLTREMPHTCLKLLRDGIIRRFIILVYSIFKIIDHIHVSYQKSEYSHRCRLGGEIESGSYPPNDFKTIAFYKFQLHFLIRADIFSYILLYYIFLLYFIIFLIGTCFQN